MGLIYFQCVFESPEKPCNYCSPRGLECGLKLPTPRKLAEWGGLAMMPGVAIGQPRTTGALQIQIPVNISTGRGYNLSSANDEPETPFGFTSPTTNGYRPYPGTAGIAPIMNPFQLGIATMPNHKDFIVQTWSPTNTPNTSPEDSSTISSPETLSCNTNACIPPRHPVHTLNASILPFVNSALPHFENPPSSSEPTPEEDWWEVCQNMWLQLDRRPSTHSSQCQSGVTAVPPVPLRLKWNRLLHIPRSMVGKKLAGKWDDDMKVKAEEEALKPVKSIMSAPGVL